MSLPYFKFMADDWLGGMICTHDMATQGIFINLCARLWKSGGYIDGDPDRLARMLHCDKHMLSNCLVLLKQDGIICFDDNNMLYVKFILAQVEERQAVSATRSKAGSKGGKANAKHMLSKCFQPEPEPEPDKQSTNVDCKRKRFAAPTLDEVSAYCAERKNQVDPQRWHNHYTSNGWRVGKSPMKDWQAAVRTWEGSDVGQPKNSGTSGMGLFAKIEQEIADGKYN